jgi:hypothetical protein
VPPLSLVFGEEEVGIGVDGRRVRFCGVANF